MSEKVKLVWVISKKHRFYEILARTVFLDTDKVVFVRFISVPDLNTAKIVPDLIVVYNMSKEEWGKLQEDAKKRKINFYVIKKKDPLPRNFSENIK